MAKQPDHTSDACYISGPMRGIPNFNGPAFMAAERKLRAMGFEIIFNPWADDVKRYGQASMTSPDGSTPGNFDLRSVIMRDLAWIANEATHIYMIPGWGFSRGANLEHDLAKYLGLTILYSYGVGAGKEGWDY